MLDSITRDNVRQHFPSSPYLQSASYKDINFATNSDILKAMQTIPFLPKTCKTSLHEKEHSDRHDVKIKGNDSHTFSKQEPIPPVMVMYEHVREHEHVPASASESFRKAKRTQYSTLWDFFPESDHEEIVIRLQRKEYDTVLKTVTRSYVKLREECVLYLKDFSNHMKSSKLPPHLILSALCMIQEIQLQIWYINSDILPLYVHKKYPVPATIRASLSILIREKNPHEITYEPCNSQDINTTIKETIEYIDEKPKVKTCKELKDMFSVLNAYTVQEIKNGLTMVMFEKLI